MAARNALGGVYQPGKPLSIHGREEIVHLYNQGYQTGEISRDLKITDRVAENCGPIQDIRNHSSLRNWRW